MHGADEAAYNAAHRPMERYALWPGSAIAAPDGAFLAVYSGIFSDDNILFRTTPRPEGPWSDARTLFQAGGHHDRLRQRLAGQGASRAGARHGEAAQVVVGCARRAGAFAGEVRLAQVALPP